MSREVKIRTLVKPMQQLYLNQKFADVHFIFPNNGRPINVPANKAILAVVSTVFESMFYGAHKKGDAIKIEDVDADAFKEFLQLFYQSEALLTVRNIGKVFRLVNRYGIVSSLHMKPEYWNGQLTSESVMFCAYQEAIAMKNAKLKAIFEREIEYLPSDSFNSKELLECDREVLKIILQMRILMYSKAFQLFKAAVAWAKRHCQRNGMDEEIIRNQKQALGDCLFVMPFGWMTGQEIDEIVSTRSYSELFSTAELGDVVCFKTIHNFQSPIFPNSPLQWDGENKWVFARENINNYCEAKFVQDEDNTWLTTSKPILLCDIEFGRIFNHFCIDIGMIFDVIIVEHEFASKVFNPDGETVYKGRVEYIQSRSGASISLLQPIKLIPHKMYRIALKSTGTLFNAKNYMKWSSGHTIDGDIKIAFHDPACFIGFDTNNVSLQNRLSTNFDYYKTYAEHKNDRTETYHALRVKTSQDLLLVGFVVYSGIGHNNYHIKLFDQGLADKENLNDAGILLSEATVAFNVEQEGNNPSYCHPVCLPAPVMLFAHKWYLFSANVGGCYTHSGHSGQDVRRTFDGVVFHYQDSNRPNNKSSVKGGQFASLMYRRCHAGLVKRLRFKRDTY